MRLLNFQQQLLTALSHIPDLSSRPAGGPPESGMVHGVALATAAGGTTWWQITARRRPGDDITRPEPPPVTGTPPAPLPAPAIPTSGPVQVADLEQALASAAGHIKDADRLARIDLYSNSGQPPVTGFGLRVECHDESALFVQLHWALRPGEKGTDLNRFVPRPTV